VDGEEGESSGRSWRGANDIVVLKGPCTFGGEMRLRDEDHDRPREAAAASSGLGGAGQAQETDNVRGPEIDSCTIRCRVGEEGYRLWNLALRLCRHVGGDDIADWQCVEVMLDHFLEVWGEKDASPPFVHILERDGWQCTVPGCRARRNLAVHHIRFRSNGGGDEDANLTVVCYEHHIQGIHQGYVRCSGRAPDKLLWELGVRPDGGVAARYHGDALVEPGPDAGPMPAEAA
jgi:hypothetical protein